MSKYTDLSDGHFLHYVRQTWLTYFLQPFMSSSRLFDKNVLCQKGTCEMFTTTASDSAAVVAPVD